jgi:hypothetical protein
MQKIFIKKYLLFTVGNICSVKRFTSASRNSLKTLKVADSTRPGLPVEIETEATVQRVEELIRADRRITIDSVATALGCFHGLAYSTMHGHLKFQKVCAL